MARLIDAAAGPLPAVITIRVGDLLRFGASGGHLLSGLDVLQLIGPFVPAVIGTNGQVLSPMSAPNAVLFLARAPGNARIDIVTGDAWHGSTTTALDVYVEP
jgi:hypothetical protein